ncbi:helix-turn-helix transcriptional regulator [Gorillibacterium massiliense]|uniref:helix-turn-helix transcriptional regulator n=1 Tax=Gorillibacterium massiliense TaxID=1280390 RepID=UPI0004B6658C|nr:AraC family transcriptional regulator [Gorillibacterium massiliense]
MRIHHFLPLPRFSSFFCYPESLGHYYDEPSHREIRENGLGTYYNLHLIMKGQGFVETGGHISSLAEGTGFLYGPGIRQSYGTLEDDPWDVRWFHFSGNHLEALLEGKGSDEPWLFSWKSSTCTPRLAEELLAAADPFLQDKEVHLSALLYELLAELAQNGVSVYETKPARVREKMRQAADWIQEHCHETITLDSAAHTFGYSPSYFSRQFHDVIGKTPFAFLNENRITRSKKLLAATDLTIQEISSKVGFSQSSYYIRRFREMEGMTPHQFRILHS